MQTVLLEVLQELKEVKQQQAETARALFDMKGNIASFEQKLAAVKIVPPAIDTEPITAVIKTGFDNVKTTIEAQPKSVIKQFRILLFPGCNTAEYYKIVFGRLLFWMMIFLIVTYLFVLGRNFIEGYINVKQIEAERFQYRKAWNYLYENSKKPFKQKMDSVWMKS